jgi:hypothetical protein
MAALYGIEAWAISAVFLIPVLYLVSLSILQNILQKIAHKRMK